MKTYTITRTISGRKIKFEVVKTGRGNVTPIFQFVCPRCRSPLCEGAVTFDLEDEVKCSRCDHEAELWHFPHTLKGSGLYTMGGHYTNDPLSIGAKKGFYYKGNRSSPVTDAGIKSEECRCAACKGRTPHQLKDDIRSLALHNLLQTVGRFG